MPLHFFLPEAYIVGAVAAWFARIGVRAMSRRSLNDYQKAYPLLRRLETVLHRTMSAVLGNSVAVVRQLRDEEAVPQEKLGLIYNGIETPQVCNGRNAAAPRSRLTMQLWFSSSSPISFPIRDISIWSKRSDSREKLVQSWRLLIVGRDDGAGPAVRSRAKQLDIDDNRFSRDADRCRPAGGE